MVLVVPKMVRLNALWSRLVRRKANKKSPIKLHSDTHYKIHKEEARDVIMKRVQYLVDLCGVSYKKIAIKNQKRRWGSCSSLGNLNFNYKLLFLPPHLRDYIIIHELCHLKQLNHGPLFWQEVATLCPAYREIEAELRKLEKSTLMNPVKIIEFSKSYGQKDQRI